MSITAILPAAVLETILLRLATLFLTGAGGDSTAARHAASELLAAYNPHTEEELFLAANIICFSFQALEALGQAADPEMSLTRVLRLRSGAVSLSREADKARRSLTQLQKARQTAETEPAPPHHIEPPTSTQPQAPIRSQTEEDRARDLRIAEGLKRLAAREAAKETQANAMLAGTILVPPSALPSHHAS